MAGKERPIEGDDETLVDDDINQRLERIRRDPAELVNSSRKRLEWIESGGCRNGLFNNESDERLRLANDQNHWILEQNAVIIKLLDELARKR